MTDVLGFVAYLLLPLIGIAIWRLDDVKRLALDGRIAVAGATGALITAIVMSGMSIAHIEWSRTRLSLVLAVLAALAALGVPRFLGVPRSSSVPRDSSLPRSSSVPGGSSVPRGSSDGPTRRARIMPRNSEDLRGTPRNRWAVGGVIVLLAITVYGLLTARETIGDLLFFWGPKGIHFYRGGTIDVDFLRNPDHFLQHRDYPPLLPLLFAWSNTVSSSFSWWAALLLSALCLAAIVAMVRAFARDDLAALLTAAVLAWCFARPWIGGGADPLLLMYEALAVCALVFVRDARAQTILAAIGLGAAIVTKVEGASFVAAVVLAMLLHRVPWKRIAVMLLPAALLLGAWLTFIIRAELLDTYRGPGQFSLQFFAGVIKGTFAQASYDAYWIPWIAPLVVVLLGDIRRARLPLTIAVLSLGATLYFYLKSPSDPTIFWIPSSAHRVLLTPLLMLLIAAAAAHAKEEVPAPRMAERGLEDEAVSGHGQVANALTSVIALKGVPE